ncbi:MAG: hypothetical protein IJH93_03995 [Lachnospiraceae bacterium]|nr:hypothetical protein [Lachnospiraceae bacterium]
MIEQRSDGQDKDPEKPKTFLIRRTGGREEILDRPLFFVPLKKARVGMRCMPQPAAV